MFAMSTVSVHQSPVYRNYDIRRLTIGAVLEAQARDVGDKVFLTWLPDGRRYTFADAHRLSNRLANGLMAQGIGQGSHVAMLMENCPELALSAFALGKIGAVAVPINAAARGPLRSPGTRPRDPMARGLFRAGADNGQPRKPAREGG